MKKNFHYVITAVFIKNDVDVKRFKPHFTKLMDIFNNRKLDNSKKIEDISLSDKVPGGIVFDFWTEKKLPSGRELQSMRRISLELAKLDPSLVVGKSHVLISAQAGNIRISAASRHLNRKAECCEDELSYSVVKLIGEYLVEIK